MTSSLLLVSFLFAAASAQSAVPADAPPAARICAKAMLPQFQTPSVPVSFQVAAKQKRPQRFSFAEEAKKYRLRADCSGDDCGCWTAEAQCEANCDPNDYTCQDHCEHVAIRCAICCCGGPC